ncbi:MAG: hypothetical protein ACTHO8_04595 [Solirubrobacterales bacterium]
MAFAPCWRWSSIGAARRPLAKKGRLKSPLEAKVLPPGAASPPRSSTPPSRSPTAASRSTSSGPEHHFVLEADSRDFHATHVAFERNRWRDRELMRAGYATLRVTHRQAETEAAAVASQIG